MFARVGWIAIAVGILLFLPATLWADRLIRMPIGYNLPPASLKIEVARQNDNGGITQYWTQVGLVGGIEVEITRLERAGRNTDSLSLQYKLLPDIGFAPAVSLGLRDITDNTQEGFSAYIALGYRLPYTPPNPFVEEMYLYGGLGAGGIKGLFVGTDIRTPYRILLSVEYDSRQWNAAISWEPLPMLRLRLYSIDRQTFYGASLSLSF